MNSGMQSKAYARLKVTRESMTGCQRIDLEKI